MRLLDLAEQLINERAVGYHTALQYRRAANRIGEFLQRPATTEDLSEATVNAWLVSVEKSGRKGTTVHNQKRGLTALWNYAAELGLCRYYEQRRIRKTRPDPVVVVARGTSDLRLLLVAAERLQGLLQTGAPAALVMQARVLVGFETGLRSGDCLALTWDSIDFRGCKISIVQHKVQRPHSALITEHTAELLGQLREHHRERPFPLTKGGMRHWELKLRESAKKIGWEPRRRESLGALRKAYGTATARTQGIEAAARGLGHAASSGTRIAKLHYVGADAYEQPIQPPTISGGSNEFHGRQSAG